ncbi:MAG: GTP 3',8-cyclase MoaA [Oscillospiraceae bacterium]|nr:GTP 3',8-cyclase MoaA [Oscillospiraceae bacterium]
MKDQFEREISYLRVSVTDRCNLRCQYCMPAEGVCKLAREDVLSYEEILEIVSAAAELGITKVRVTGGEPLVRPGVPELCARIGALPGIREVSVTTNGVLLERYAQELKEAGVRRVNVSLDTMNPEKYRTITGGGELSMVLAGVRAAAEAGLRPLKLNAVLIGGFNDDEIEAFVELTRDQDIQLRFIELMPLGPGAAFGPEAYLPGDTVLARVPELEPEAEDGGVARLYRLPGGKGKVGLIAPVNRHFCSTCNRLRLTSEGHLKPCLHSAQEVPLRGLHGAALREAVAEAIRQKPAAHGDLTLGHASEAGRAMNTIGG